MPGSLTPGPVKQIQEEVSPLTPSNAAGPRRTHHTRRVLVGIVLILLVLAVGTGAAYLIFLNHTLVSNIQHEALLPTPSAGEIPPVDGSSGNDPPVGGSSGTDALNILLIGSDSKTSVANGRSDVIILMHISSDRKKVYLVHFPRDMYVEVPGHGKDKINAAYAYGGSQLLVRTLQGMVDVTIDHAAVIGFEGFKAMTDAVGGVDAYAEEASDEWGIVVHVGINHLDGEAALAFVRERYQLSKGDISRGRRQQEFVKALMLKVLSTQTLTNPVRFAAIVNAVARNLTLDSAFSVADLYSQALAMKNLRGGDVIFITAPITGFGRSPQGASIDIVDEAGMAQMSAALKNDNMSSLSLGQ